MNLLTLTMATPPLGAQLKAHRERHALAQSEVSRRAHISETYYGKIELGQRRPSEDVLKKIVTALELTPAQAQAVVGTWAHEGMPDAVRKYVAEPRGHGEWVAEPIPVFSYGTAGEGLNIGPERYPRGQGEFTIIRSADNHDLHAYAIQIRGRSMYPYLYDGDVLEVRTDVEVVGGSIAVVLHQDGRAWIKRVKFFPRRRGVLCEPINGDEEAFELPVATVRLHKVVSIRRRGMY